MAMLTPELVSRIQVLGSEYARNARAIAEKLREERVFISSQTVWRVLNGSGPTTTPEAGKKRSRAAKRGWKKRRARGLG